MFKENRHKSAARKQFPAALLCLRVVHSRLRGAHLNFYAANASHFLSKIHNIA
jgi:hypothetical protein